MNVLISAILTRHDYGNKIVRIKIGVDHRYPNVLRALREYQNILSPHVVPEAYRDY